MILSICIATVPERQAQFDALRKMLGDHPEVEYVIDPRPRGELSVGAKRQSMIEHATGQYVVHIDDDDHVAPDYIQTVVSALASGPDCIGHYEVVEGMAPAPQLSKWTKDAPRWMEGREAQRYKVDYVRTTFHKTPLKREHALAIGFKDMRFAEDHDFSKRLKASGLCRTEVFIPRVLYIYRYSNEPHEQKYGIR